MKNDLPNTKSLLDYLEQLNQGSATSIPEGFNDSENDLVKQFIHDAKGLINQNEWGIGLENLLDNLYEIDFRLDDFALQLANYAIKECGLNHSDWAYLNDLRK